MLYTSASTAQSRDTSCLDTALFQGPPPHPRRQYRCIWAVLTCPFTSIHGWSVSVHGYSCPFFKLPLFVMPFRYSGLTLLRQRLVLIFYLILPVFRPRVHLCSLSLLIIVHYFMVLLICSGPYFHLSPSMTPPPHPWLFSVRLDVYNIVGIVFYYFHAKFHVRHCLCSPLPLSG